VRLKRNFSRIFGFSQKYAP
jgi:hypothetical protein